MSPHRARISVVFPEPLGPSRPNTSPRPTLRVARSTAVNLPKRRVPSGTWMAGWLGRLLAGVGAAWTLSMNPVPLSGSAQGERHVRSHARLEHTFRVLDADLDAEHLVAALVGAL